MQRDKRKTPPIRTVRGWTAATAKTPTPTRQEISEILSEFDRPATAATPEPLPGARLLGPSLFPQLGSAPKRLGPPFGAVVAAKADRAADERFTFMEWSRTLEAAAATCSTNVAGSPAGMRRGARMTSALGALGMAARPLRTGPSSMPPTVDEKVLALREPTLAGSFESPTVLAEVVMAALMDHCAARRQLRHANDPLRPYGDLRLRVATACLVLDRLLAAGALPPVMRVVRAELMNGVFVSHTVDLAARFRSAPHGPGSTSPNATQEGPRATTPGLGPGLGEAPPVNYYDMRTFAEACEEMSHQQRDLETIVVAERQKRDIKAAAVRDGQLSGAHRLLKLFVFRSWRHIARRSPGKVAKRFLRMVTASGLQSLGGVYFFKWRSFLAHKNLGAAKDIKNALVAALESRAPKTFEDDPDTWDDDAFMQQNQALVQEQHRRKSWAVGLQAPGAEGGDEAEDGVIEFDRLHHATTKRSKDELIAQLRVDVKQLEDKTDALTQALRNFMSPDAIEEALQVAGESMLAVSLQQRRESTDRVVKLPDQVKLIAGADAPLSFLENAPVEELLLLWANVLLEHTKENRWDLRAQSLELSFVDGKIFTVLAAHLFPEFGCDSLVLLEPASKRLEHLMAILYSIGQFDQTFVTVADVLQGNVGTYVLVAWLYKEWYRQNQSEIETCDSGITPDDIESALSGTRLVYHMANAIHLNRLLGKGFQRVYDRIAVWVNAQLMVRVREGTADSNSIVDAHDFSTVEVYYFGEVEAALADARAETTKCGVILKQSYSQLKKIYEFYRVASVPINTSRQAVAPQGQSRGAAAVLPAATPPHSPKKGVVTLLSAKEFLRFVEDTGLTNRVGVTRATVATTMDALLRRQHHGAPPGDSHGDGHGALQITKRMFVEALVHLSALAAAAASKTVDKGAVAVTLGLLLNENVFPRAMASAKLDFKKQVSDPRVQDVLTNRVTAKFLTKVYRHYAAMDTQGKHNMARKHFIQMLVELQIIDRHMKKADVLAIFTDVQDDEGEGGDEAGDVMSFSEFGEAITAIAMFKHPHPLQSVHQRLQLFLDKTFIPTCKSHLAAKRF